MPSCKKCGAQIDQNRIDRFSSLCSLCYITNTETKKRGASEMIFIGARTSCIIITIVVIIVGIFFWFAIQTLMSI